MLKVILQRELQHNLYSLRFQIALCISVLLFIVGTLSFLKSYDSATQKYSEFKGAFLEELQNDAQENAGRLAVSRRTYLLRPRSNSFISDCREKYLPNAIVFNAYNVFSFLNRRGSANPFLQRFQELNWSFVTTLIISFVVLLLTFDSISGEKEKSTLSLTLANATSRGTLLFGKYLSAILVTMVIILLGVLLSILIILTSNRIVLSVALLIEIIGFLMIILLLVGCMAAVGLFTSVLSKNSNVSMLLALMVWLTFAVVIPNSSIYCAKEIFAIENEEGVQERINRAHEDLDRNAPEGSWAMNYSQPFAPEHELRANLQTKRLNAEKEIRDAYYEDMFRQFRNTRLMTVISPISLFDFMAESLLGGGYARFRKVWEDMHVYQGQLLAFFKDIDMQDPDSPHWYNPFEDVSTTRKAVSFESVPLFDEKPTFFTERMVSLRGFVMIAILYTAVIFSFTFVLFSKYDVRG